MAARGSRRRRSRRRRGVSPQALRVVAVVALMGAFAYIALATTVGTFLAEKLIAPIFRVLSGEEAPPSPTPGEAEVIAPPASTDSNALPLMPSGGYSPTTAPPASTDGVTGEVRLPSRTYYVLQLGAFSNEQNAEKLAGELKDRSAAGYIYADEGLFRVIAAAYESKDDARAVKEQLMAQAGLDSKVNELVLPAVALRVTSITGEDALTAVQDAFAAAEETCSALFDLCAGFDKGTLTAQAAVEKLNELADSCEQPAKALSGEPDKVPEMLAALLSEMAADLRACAARGSENTVEFSAALKYTQIKEMCAFADFLEEIKKEIG